MKPFEKLSFNMAFQAWTPESLEEGDCADQGFIFEDESFEFGQLVTLIKRNGFYGFSNSDGTGWLYNSAEIVDYSTGRDEARTLHANNERSFRYMKKAFNYVHHNHTRLTR